MEKDINISNNKVSYSAMTKSLNFNTELSDEFITTSVKLIFNSWWNNLVDNLYF